MPSATKRSSNAWACAAERFGFKTKGIPRESAMVADACAYAFQGMGLGRHTCTGRRPVEAPRQSGCGRRRKKKQMFNVQKESFEWGGRTLTLETGKVARQADGAVVATYGETVVLATVVGDEAPREGVDFFPLTVNYQERYYAAGKIPGGYFKRERAPTERETLISRLIDRPIRPLFAEGYRNETQVVVQVLSHDMENDPDVVGMVAASAALTISGIPFMGPIGAARVGYINGEYVLNPMIDTYPESKLDLVVAGTQDAVMMVESEAQELSEEVMLGAVVFGHQQMQAAINAIIRLAEKAAKDPRPLTEDTTGPVRERLKVAASAE